MRQCLDPTLPVRILGVILAEDEFGASLLDYSSRYAGATLASLKVTPNWSMGVLGKRRKIANNGESQLANPSHGQQVLYNVDEIAQFTNRCWSSESPMPFTLSLGILCHPVSR